MPRAARVVKVARSRHCEGYRASSFESSRLGPDLALKAELVGYMAGQKIPPGSGPQMFLVHVPS